MGLGKLLGKAADITYSTVAEAIQNWIKENPKEASYLERQNITPDVRVLKDSKYRNIRFDEGMSGDKTSAMTVEGKFYYTVGEYNDAVDKAMKDYHDGHNYGNAMQDDNRY